MTDIKIFEREEFGSVRVVMRDDEPWFVAKDVCSCLELDNVSEAINGLDEDEKITLSNPDGNPRAGIPLSFNIISEAGMYSLVLRSRKPEAKDFKRWVTHEVLPSIRKTGSYSMAPQTYPEALRALAAEVELREAEKQQRLLAEHQRDEAIRTKAQIGSRREATAMNTASVAVRQRDALADRLGEGRKWKTVKAIPWLMDEFCPSRGMYSQVGRKLSEMSQRMGYPVHSVDDSSYGEVKAYHIAVIASFHTAIRKDRNMLGKYRRDA